MKDRSRAEDIAGGLAAGDADARLKSLRTIKNNVIGSKREKTKHLLYLPIILEILSTDQEVDVLIQAAQAIGSFATASDGAKAVIDKGGVPKLFFALRHPDIRVVEASARALKLLYTKTADINQKEVRQVFETPGADATLVDLLSTSQPSSLSESAAWIIARCCEIDMTENAKSYFLNASALRPLVRLLQDGSHKNRQAAALSAIAALTHNAPTTCIDLLQYHHVVLDLVNCVKSSSDHPRMRFTACVCLTNILPALSQLIGGNGGGGSFRGRALLSGSAPSTRNRKNGYNAAFSIEVPTREEVEDIVLPVLVRLMKEESDHNQLVLVQDKGTTTKQRISNTSTSTISTSSIVVPPQSKTARTTTNSTATPTHHLNEGGGGGLVAVKNNVCVAAEVPGVLLQLLAENSALQAAAVDADAILYLSSLLKSQNIGPKGKINSFLVLGMLLENVEAHRQKLVDCGALPAVAAALTDPSLPVRGAACCCMKSLSRSTRLLRCSLGSLADIAGPLLELSRIDDVSISTEASATLANMAIEYSSLKEQVIVLQGIARFVELTEAYYTKLRLYGVWGLSSAVYLSSDEIKNEVMRSLPWNKVVRLLDGSDQDVKEKTLLLLRNLAHRGGGGGGGTGGGAGPTSLSSGGSNPAAPPASTSTCSLPFLTVLEWSQGEFVSKILDSISAALIEERESEVSPKQFEHALYALVNIASGQPSDKDALGILIPGVLGDTIVTGLYHSQESIREAAVWLIINLTWVQDGGDPGLERRKEDLKAKRIEQDLLILRNQDTSMRVKERADTAWFQLHSRGELASGGGGGGGERMVGVEIGEDAAAGAIAGLRGRMTLVYNDRGQPMYGSVLSDEAMDEEDDDIMDEGEDEEEEEDGDGGDEGLPW